MTEATTDLVDVLDRLLDVGAVIGGDAIVTVADVPLVHLGLRLVLRGIDPGPPRVGVGVDAAVDAAVDAGVDEPTDARTTAPGATEAPVPSATGAPGPSEQPRLDAVGVPAADAGRATTGTQPVGGSDAAPSGLGPDPAAAQRGLAGLVLTLVETLRELLERQAIRRMESGSLGDDELDRLGEALREIRDAVARLAEEFDLDPDDLRIDLGPLEDLL